jgi:PhnB protein
MTQAIRHARADERESDAALTDERVAAQAALDYHPALVAITHELIEGARGVASALLRSRPYPRRRVMAVKPIPEGYQTVSPYLAVDDAGKAIEYYKKAFGAKERGRMDTPDGGVAHAEIEIGDSVVMLSDPMPQGSTKPPKELGGTSASVFLYVEDVDAIVKQAVDAGATVLMEVTDQFWGDRFGTIQDPFGHTWSIATHVEDLTPEQIAERGKAAMAEMTG